jgi:stress-induced morphogen
MGISIEDLEASIRAAFQIIHLEILDQSSGCGESYFVFIVSSVS